MTDLDAIREKVARYEEAFRSQSIARMMSAPHLTHDDAKLLLARIDQLEQQLEDADMDARELAMGEDW